jgi:chitinase
MALRRVRLLAASAAGSLLAVGMVALAAPPGAAAPAAGAHHATTTNPSVRAVPSAGGLKKVAYFDQWGIYVNAYYPKNLQDSGLAGKLDVLQYAFENIDPTNLTCFEATKASHSGDDGEKDPNAGDGAGDQFADYQKSYDSSISVDGQADTYDQPLKGNFNQLKKLKAKNPNLKILVSLGGWTYSKYFHDVALTDDSRKKFAQSCINMFIKGNLPDLSDGAAAGIFDGFDFDWEYPGVVGHLGNHVGPEDKANYTKLLQEFRTELDALGSGKYLMSAALPAGQDKIAQVETDKVGKILDFGDVMTYDMHGGWEATGPTDSQAPMTNNDKDPSKPVPPGKLKYNVATAITAWLKGLPDYGIKGGFPADKLYLGLPGYWRGWTGVPDGGAHGLYQTATAPSAQFNFSQQKGVAMWKELKTAGLTDNASDNFTDPDAGSFIYDGTNFYSGCTPDDIKKREQWAASQGLGGAFIYSLEDDDPDSTIGNAFVGG